MTSRFGAFVLVVVSAAVLACSKPDAPGSAQRAEDKLPEACDSYLTAYQKCIGALGTHSSALAVQNTARTRAALVEQMKAGDATRVNAQCLDARKSLRAACE